MDPGGLPVSTPLTPSDWIPAIPGSHIENDDDQADSPEVEEDFPAPILDIRAPDTKERFSVTKPGLKFSAPNSRYLASRTSQIYRVILCIRNTLALKMELDNDKGGSYLISGDFETSDTSWPFTIDPKSETAQINIVSQNELTGVDGYVRYWTTYAGVRQPVSFYFTCKANNIIAAAVTANRNLSVKTFWNATSCPPLKVIFAVGTVVDPPQDETVVL